MLFATTPVANGPRLFWNGAVRRYVYSQGNNAAGDALLLRTKPSMLLSIVALIKNSLFPWAGELNMILSFDV
jgi:hypothetical protein